MRPALILVLDAIFMAPVFVNHCLYTSHMNYIGHDT